MIQYLVRGVARPAAERAALRSDIQDAVAAMRHDVETAVDAAMARAALTHHWRRLHVQRLASLSTIYSDSSDVRARAMMRLFDAPGLQAIPLYAQGLRHVPEENVWVGSQAMIAAAAEVMAYAGCATRYAPDRGHAELLHDGHVVTTFLVDPDFVARPAPAPDWTPTLRRPVLEMVGAVILIAGFYLALSTTHVGLGVGLMALAPLVYIVGKGGVFRRRRARRHTLEATPIRGAAPYRDATQSAAPTLAELGAALARAGLPARLRGDQLELDKATSLRRTDDRLTVTFAELPVAMRCVHAVVAITGALRVECAGTVTMLGSDEDLAAWQAARRVDDVARAELVEAIAQGHHLALQAIDG